MPRIGSDWAAYASATFSSGTATIGADGTASITATANGTAGTYSVTASASGAATPAAFALTNQPNQVQPVFSGLTDQTITYGTGSVVFSGSLADGSQVPAGDDVTVTLDGVPQEALIGSDGSFSTTFTTATLGVAGSPYTVSYAFQAQGLFLGADGTSQLTINPAAISYTIGNDSHVYGSTADLTADLPATFDTGINGENLAITYASSGNTATAQVGTYNINGSVSNGTGLASDYTVSLTNGTMTVNPATLTITANSTSKTYGQVITFAGSEFTATGLVNGNAVTSVTLTSSGAVATAHVAGSPYAILASNAVGNGLGNYAIIYHVGSLAVIPAPLTIVADNKSMSSGGAVPTLTASYSGFVNGDTPASLATPVKLSTAATSGSPAGAYTITASGASSPDYTISDLNSTLTVTPSVTPALPRYRAGDSFVTTLYAEVLGRAPEPEGFHNWMRRYMAGTSPLIIMQGFARSPERHTLEKEGLAPSIPLRVAYNDALRAAHQAAQQPAGPLALSGAHRILAPRARIR
jgi:hypothetical protein